MTEVPHPPFASPDFWAAYYFDQYAPEAPAEDDETADSDDFVARYHLGGECALIVDSGAHGVSLELAHPSADRPVELSWDDLAQGHPHTLRWSEADVMCRAAALADPDIGYPGPYLALVSRFTPICTDADAAFAAPMLHEAFAALPGLDRYQRNLYAAQADIRAYGVHWKHDEATGWYPEHGGDIGEEAGDPLGDDPDAADYLIGDLYSTRHPDNSAFPFAELAAAVEQARARCAALRDQPWAAQAAVQLAAQRFADQPTAACRAALADQLRTAGCADQAVLAALSPTAGDLRALVMTELLLGADSGSLVRAYSGTAVPRPLRRYYANAYLPVASADATHDGLAEQVKPHLNAALRAAGLGSTQDGPSRLGRRDGSWVDDIPLDLIDDWHAGAELIREVLRAAGAPHGSVGVRRRGETVLTTLDRPMPRG